MDLNEENLKKFKKALKKTKEFKELSDAFMVVIKWTYSRKWGNYSARAFLKSSDGTYLKGTLSSGAGYDKPSDAMASVLNLFLKDLIKKAVKLARKYKVKLPYGLNEYKGDVWINGGIGVSSVEAVLRFSGFKKIIADYNNDVFIYQKE